ncbi:MAG: type II toxin-antitoxin system HicB family antitoxin [Proteobacteria bacterium]|nr:type II toxin-antitoxin system HicB family antitoxin [Pseudomonadota bacterium]
MDYVVIVEKAENSFGAYVPGPSRLRCSSHTREELLPLITEAIAFHLEGLQLDGQVIPAPSSSIELVHVEA